MTDINIVEVDEDEINIFPATSPNDEWFQHEGLDRTSMIIHQVYSAFGDSEDPDELHPSIYNEECLAHLQATTTALCNLYQAIGRWEDSTETETK
jgi:hypothetical protein